MAFDGSRSRGTATATTTMRSDTAVAATVRHALLPCAFGTEISIVRPVRSLGPSTASVPAWRDDGLYLARERYRFPERLT
jgi:hypothetical protein